MTTSQPWKIYAIVVMAALLPRLVLAIFFPDGGGDTLRYGSVALNILQNGCVSLSDPTGGDCIPHWGGNQLPGYPIFLSIVWAVFGVSWLSASIVQIILVTAAICYLLRAIHRLCGEWYPALAVGLTVALSPLQIPWSRMALTETLSFAAIIWVFAELAFSLAANRLRVWPLGLSITAAIFIRYDNAFLCLAIAICGFYLHDPKQALLRGTLISAIVAAPLLGWMVRGVAQGLRAVPHVTTLEDGGAPPLGYLNWGKSWTTNQYQYPPWIYPIQKKTYQEISIDPGIYVSENEQKKVESLLKELRAYQYKPFPKHIDAEFERLAQARYDQNPLWYGLGIRFLRSWNTWFNLKNSAGWPVKILGLNYGEADQSDQSGFSRLWTIAYENPLSAAVRGITGLYRIGLLVAISIAFIYSIRVDLGTIRPIVWGAAAIAFGRLYFFAALDAVETRYALGAVPGIEIALCLFALKFLLRSRKRPG